MFCPQASLALVLIVIIAGSSGGQYDRNVVDPVTGRPRDIFCYQCNSRDHPDCFNLQVNNTNSIYYKPCNRYNEYKGARPFCRKMVQTIIDRGNLLRVVRKCGWERHPKRDCYESSDKDHSEVVCQCFHDGCNPAAKSALTAPLITALLAFASSLC